MLPGRSSPSSRSAWSLAFGPWSEPADAVERSEIVASAAVVLSSGFAFRSIARSARRVLPAPIVHAAVAVAGTYLLAKALTLRRHGSASRKRSVGQGPAGCAAIARMELMPDTELAEELLQLEEADAWFEYLESTRGQARRAIPSSSRGRGLACPSACEPCVHAAPACGPPLRDDSRRGRPARPTASLSENRVDHSLEPTQREAGAAGGCPGPARDHARRTQPWHYAGFALARSRKRMPRKRAQLRRRKRRLRLRR